MEFTVVEGWLHLLGSGAINSDRGCRNAEEPASVRSFARRKGSSAVNHLPDFSYAIALLVVGSGLDDPLGDRPIAAGRVDRHQRALEAQLVEQRGDHGALVRLAVHDLLGQYEALLACVGRQGVQRALAGAGVAGPLRGLAVDRDQASGRIAPIQASKHSSKVPGSSALTTSLSVSWLGTPRANGRIERKASRFRRAQPAISTMLSAPARQPASAISRISSSRYNTLPRWPQSY